MNLLPTLPLWLVGIVLVALCLLSSELGQFAYRKISAWRPEVGSKEGRVDMEGFIIGSVFGLFAFIIGFTFSIALDRFDARRHLVTEEANAIQTSFDRAEIMNAASRFPLQIVLRDYAHTRISPEGLWDAEKQIQLEHSRHLRERLWAAARNSVMPYRDTDLGVSIAESVNEVLNVGTRREFEGVAHVPDRVMDALILYLIASSALLGYLTAAQPYRLRAASSLLFVLMTMAIILIIDLDRPRAGSIVVSQAALEELVARLDRIQLTPQASLPSVGLAPPERANSTPG